MSQDDKFNKDQLDELKEAFELFDKDKDGKISIKELSAVLKTLGHNVTDKDLTTML